MGRHSQTTPETLTSQNSGISAEQAETDTPRNPRNDPQTTTHSEISVRNDHTPWTPRNIPLTHIPPGVPKTTPDTVSTPHHHHHHRHHTHHTHRATTPRQHKPSICLGFSGRAAFTIGQVANKGACRLQPLCPQSLHYATIYLHTATFAPATIANHFMYPNTSKPLPAFHNRGIHAPHPIDDDMIPGGFW